MAENPLEEAYIWLHNQLNGAIAFIVLTVLVLTLRFFGVNRKKKATVSSFRWEEILLITSLVAFLPMCACAIVNAKAYIAYYSSTRRDEQRKHYKTIYTMSYGFSVVYPIACALPKMSICCMYLGIFDVSRYMRRGAQIMIGFLCVNAVAWVVPSIAVCHPISAYWSPVGPRKCINYNVFGTWISLPNIISDLVIFILPLPLLWNMQLKRAKKIGLTATFLAGTIGIVAGNLRLALYIRRTYINGVVKNESTKSTAGEMIASYTEPGMYLVAACLPRLRALIAKLYTTLSTSLSSLSARLQASIRAGNTSRKPSDEVKCDNVPLVDVKLTGQGNLESLARAKNAIS